MLYVFDAGKVEVVKILCIHGASINELAMDNTQAIHFACQKGTLPILIWKGDFQVFQAV